MVDCPGRSQTYEKHSGGAKRQGADSLRERPFRLPHDTLRTLLLMYLRGRLHADAGMWAGVVVECDSSTSGGYSALWVGDAGTTLTIQGSTGKLNVTSSGDYCYCAGIGGVFFNTQGTCGDIRIEGGVITAQGGQGGAGIGADCIASCGNITITGGTITATGGEDAAGIGSGDGTDGEASHLSECGHILISGGTVTAYGFGCAAAIGCGRDADCGKISITITGDENQVTATKDPDAPAENTNSIGAGTGGSTCGTITIGDTTYPNGITESPFIYSQP